MPLRLTNASDDPIPVDFDGVDPAALRPSSLDEVKALRIGVGARSVRLGERFELDGDPTDGEWILRGDWRHVHRVGAGMTGGRIVVEASVGQAAGSGMSGGRLEILGDAGDWLGAEMRGGVIRVSGNAGAHVGSARPGGKYGINGGAIYILGDVGAEAGFRMRRGLIAIAGDAGPRLGLNMLAGTIVVLGDCTATPGAGMRRGTIAVLGGSKPSCGPTFRPGYAGPLPILRMLQAQFAAEGFADATRQRMLDEVELHQGDFLHSGRGELIVAAR